MQRACWSFGAGFADPMFTRGWIKVYRSEKTDMKKLLRGYCSVVDAPGSDFGKVILHTLDCGAKLIDQHVSPRGLCESVLRRVEGLKVSCS